MSIFSKLTEKPWLTPSGSTAQMQDGREFSLTPSTVALRVFFGVITVVFLLFSAAYVDRLTFPDWRPLPEPWLLWVNTGVLITSSVAMQWALHAARRNNMSRTADGLLAGGVFSIAFLVGQALAWWQMAGLGYFDAKNPASAFFYLLTFVHAVHIFGGVVAWGRTMAKVWRGAGLDAIREGVSLCTAYWHFLLLIWLVLFGLLIST